jgi:hypothetical protein
MNTETYDAKAMANIRANLEQHAAHKRSSVRQAARDALAVCAQTSRKRQVDAAYDAVIDAWELAAGF